MSAASRPSFRAYFKDKIKQNVKPNVTSSVRERLISNETYHHVRDKYHNFTDVAKNRTGFSNLVNKTKSLLPGGFSSKDNSTAPKGFYDSVFSPQTDEDVYFKTAIICLWVIAMLCILPTIITIFIPARKKPSKTTGVKMIFFHIFLCELCYLIYILLSMINVAQSFQLNTFFCNFANYGMYITVPVMHFALLFLSIERITKFCANTMTWMKIFTKPYVIQVILVAIWLIFIASIATILMLKNQFSLKSIASRANELAPPILGDITKKLASPYRCSIDGRLSAIFKVLFIVLFCILIVLIIKSMVVSVFYKFFTPTCCTSNGGKRKPGDLHMTVLYLLFLFLNLFFSFPFYFISITHSIFSRFNSTKDAFSTKLKICFLLRLISIILQCLAFAVIESNSWSLLSRLLFFGTCKRIAALNRDGVDTKKPTTNGTTPRADVQANNDDADSSASENEEPVIRGTDDDVRIDESRNRLLKTREKVRATKMSSDDNDSGDESPVTPKPRRSTEKKELVESTRQKKEEAPAKKPVSERTSREKSSSQRTPSASANGSTAKSRPDHNATKSRPAKPSSSSEATSDDHVESDGETKPFTTVRKEARATPSPPNSPGVTTIVVSHDRRQTKRSPTFQRAANRSKYQHTAQRRGESPRNTNQRPKKSKQDRIHRIQDQSDDV